MHESLVEQSNQSGDAKRRIENCLTLSGTTLEAAAEAERDAPSQREDRLRQCFVDGGWELAPEPNWANPVIMASRVPTDRRQEFAAAYFRCTGQDPTSDAALHSVIIAATADDALIQEEMNKKNGIDDAHKNGE